MNALFQAIESSHLACATCMAGIDDVNTQAAAWSIMFLVGIIGPVLGALICFALYLRKAARRQEATI